MSSEKKYGMSNSILRASYTHTHTLNQNTHAYIVANDFPIRNDFIVEMAHTADDEKNKKNNEDDDRIQTQQAADCRV